MQFIIVLRSNAYISYAVTPWDILSKRQIYKLIYSIKKDILPIIGFYCICYAAFEINVTQ